MPNKEEILRDRILSTGTVYSAMDEYAKPYKEIADLISRIFHYGNFKAETSYERLLEKKLTDVGLWPTSEDEIINRPLLS